MMKIEAKEVYIVDDIFLINRKRLDFLGDIIEKYNIKKNFLVYSRADFIAENPDVITRWAKLGLKAVFIGLEAVLDSELQEMNKNCSVDHNLEAIRILRENKVDIYGSLIPGVNYKREDWKRLWRFIKENQLYFINVSPITPLPGADTYENTKGELTVPEDAHALFDLSHMLLQVDNLKKYYRELLFLYSRIILNLYRAKKVTQGSTYSVFSISYLLVILGTLKIGWQFWNAHKHHSLRKIKKKHNIKVNGPKVSLSRTNMNILFLRGHEK